MTLDTQIADFKLKRAAIEKLQAEVNADKQALDAWVGTTEIGKKWVAKADELNKKLERYRAETKAAFGLADGERSDIVDLVAAIKKVSTLD